MPQAISTGKQATAQRGATYSAGWKEAKLRTRVDDDDNASFAACRDRMLRDDSRCNGLHRGLGRHVHE
jgi:hypothetical protein